MRRIENGLIAYNVRDYQAAIRLLSEAYLKRFGCPAELLALPANVPTGLDLLGLALTDTPASPGCVMAGGAKKSTYTQETLL